MSQPTDAANANAEVVDLIAAALCDQEEQAEREGGNAWWGMGTDFTSEIAAVAVAAQVEALESERSVLAAKIEAVERTVGYFERQGHTTVNLLDIRRALAATEEPGPKDDPGLRHCGRTDDHGAHHYPHGMSCPGGYPEEPK